MKKLIIISLFLFLPLLVFLLGRADFLLNRVERLIPELTDGAIKVDDIKGNLLFSIRVHNFRVGETVAIDSLTIRYSLISLLQRRIYYASAGRMVIDIKTSNGSSGSGGFAFPVNIDKTEVRELKVKGAPPHDDEMSLYQISASIVREKQGMTIQFNLDRGRWIDVPLKNVDGTFSYIDGKIEMNQITLNTEHSHFFADLISDAGRFNLIVHRSNIALEEFAHIIGQDVEGSLEGSFEVKTGLAGWGELILNRIVWRGYTVTDGKASFTMKDDIIDLRFRDIVAYNGSVNGTGEIAISPFSYRLRMDIKDVTLDEIWEIPGSVSGEVLVDKNGAKIDLSSTLYGYKIESIKGALSFDGMIDLAINEKLSITGRIKQERLNLNISSKGFDISPFLPIKGDLFGDGVVRGNRANPIFSGSFYIADFHYKQIQGQYISSSFTVNLPPSEGKFDLTGVGITIPGMDLNKIEGTLLLSEKSFFNLIGEGEEVSLSIAGNIENEILRIDTLIYSKEDITIKNRLPVEAIVKPKYFLIKQCVLSIDGGSLELKGRFDPQDMALSGLGEELSLSSLDKDLKGLLNISFNIEGPLLTPSIQSSLQLTDAIIEGIRVDTVLVSAQYRDSLLIIESSEIVIGQERSDIEGSIPLVLFPPEIPEGEIDLALRMRNLPPGIWNLFQNHALIRAGKTDIELKITGQSGSPEISGWADMKSLSLDLPLYGVSFQNINSRVRFLNGRLEIESFTGKSGDGNITADGEILISGLLRDAVELSLNIKARDITVRIPEGEGEIDMNINLSGTLAHPVIKGDIEVERAEILFIVREEMPATEANYDLILNIDLSRVWIRTPLPAIINPIPGIENPLAELEMAGDLSVIREGREVFITGDMGVKQGYFYYIDRPFKIEDGRFVFDNIAGFDPLVTLRARSDLIYSVLEEGIRRQDTTIVYITLDGRMSSLNFSIYSEPSLPLDGILTLLTLNVPSLHAVLDQFRVTDVPDRLLNFLIRGTVLSYMEDLLGVDALWLETALIGEEKKARLTAGKYISPDLYASYTRDLFSPTWSFQTRYHLFRGISLTGERTEDNEYSAGIEIEVRY